MVDNLNIIVCVKQIPKTEKVKFNWEKGALVRRNIENIMNPDDLHAIEMALRLRSDYGGKITVITMGPPQAEDVLREAYSFGADECILITDRGFAGSDSLITSKILSRVIEKLGNFNLIITGKETLDGNTGQVSYQLAEFLGIPHLCQTHDIKFKENFAVIERLYGHEYQKVKCLLPILIAMDRDTNKLRHPRLIDIKNSFEKEIKIMTMEDIGGAEDEYGFPGSPTVVVDGEIVQHKRKHEVFEGTTQEKIEKLIAKLKKYQILKQ